MLRFIDPVQEIAKLAAKPVTIKVTEKPLPVTESPSPVTIKRGRPSTGAAKPNAERQAAFRKRRTAAKQG